MSLGNNKQQFFRNSEIQGAGTDDNISEKIFTSD